MQRRDRGMRHYHQEVEVEERERSEVVCEHILTASTLGVRFLVEDRKVSEHIYHQHSPHSPSPRLCYQHSRGGSHEISCGAR